MIRGYDTVDGRNPAPVSRYCTLSHYLEGFCTSQVVQDFFHQQYLFITESWNTIFVSAFFWQICKADRIQLLPAANRFWCILFRWFSWNSWTFDQCVYLSYVAYAYSAYIYICIYIYFPKFWDVLFQKKFRSNESNACLLGGTCFFLWKFSQTLWSLTFLSETFRPKKRHTKNSTRRPKNCCHPEILAHCVDLHCGLWHHCLGGSLWDS